MRTPTTNRLDPVVSRREFLRASATAAVGAFAAAPLVANSTVLGANERVGIGFIGVGGRGSYHVATVKGMIGRGAKLRIIGVSDAYGPRKRAQAIHTQSKAYANNQALLADPAVDVVCIATPDRLHLPIGLAALQAGKDLYCEKPMGHWSQFDLSKRFFQETRRLGRVVQIGNQGNSSPAWRLVGELLRQGVVGRPQLMTAGYYRYGDWGERMPIPDPKARPGPDLDWDAFLDGAPKVPFTVERFFSWRRYLDYAGGPCTDLFPHVLTPFIHLLGLEFPTRGVASGGIFKYDTYDRQVPDTFNLCLDYPQKLSLVLVCTEANDHPDDPAIRGDAGTITLQSPEWESGFDSVTVIPRQGKRRTLPGAKPNSTLLHWENFLDCVRSRRRPVSDVEFGFHVQAALDMALTGFLSREVARFDLKKQEVLPAQVARDWA